jgi:hypothetical protein
MRGSTHSDFSSFQLKIHPLAMEACSPQYKSENKESSENYPGVCQTCCQSCPPLRLHMHPKPGMQLFILEVVPVTTRTRRTTLDKQGRETLLSSEEIKVFFPFISSSNLLSFAISFLFLF